MKDSGERYSPRVGRLPQVTFEPFISYEHWHRYRYASGFVAGKSVLDIASGEGYGGAFLADHARQVVGVDVSAEAVEHANATYRKANLHFLHGSAEAIPIEGSALFDAIVSFETVEHLDAPGQARFAREIIRLLKPDGTLLISTPNRVTYSEGQDGKNEYHLHEMTREEFHDYLSEHFRHVSMMSQHVYPVSHIWNLDGPKGASRDYRMKLVDHAFRPIEADEREVDYLIAVCDNADSPADAPDSTLTDLSEVAFRGIPECDRWRESAIFLDTGAGFRAEEMIREQVRYAPDFEVQFTFETETPIRQVRWDPLETRLCRVRVREVAWQDREGQFQRLDPDNLASNGHRDESGWVRFDTVDPMFFLPISGRLQTLTIRGECVIDTETQTLHGLAYAMYSRDATIAKLGEELRICEQRLAKAFTTSAAV